MRWTDRLKHALVAVLATPLLACAATDDLPGAAVPGGEADDSPIPGLALRAISTDFDVPWGIAPLPGGELLVSERAGRLYRLTRDGQKTPISGLPSVAARGQGGLLDVAAHPDFADNRWVYLSYAKPLQSGLQTAIARAELRGDRLVELTDLYVGNFPSTGGRHFGSRLALRDGYLFFSIGDRGDRDRNPQNLGRDGGKVYRLHDDGRIPTDNPFVGVDGALPALWSYGHRNPQGMSFDPVGGQLWVHEHGPRGGDELNHIEAGENYGWPLATFGVNYVGTRVSDHRVLDGTRAPDWHWTPSIAPSGLAAVHASTYPALGDGLLAGSLKFGQLHFRPSAEGARFRVVMRGLQRVRSIATDQQGRILVGISGAGVFELVDPSRSAGAD